MAVDLKKVYAKVAEDKKADKRKTFVKVSNNGAILGINGNKEKVGDIVKNLYASQRDVIDFKKLETTDLSNYHMILMGSHDKKSPLAGKLKKYIEEGGFLVTTGECLDTIVAELFPNIVEVGKQEIKGGVFKGEISSLEHPFIKGATKKKAMKFWVDDKTHPIEKVEPSIEELASSKKLEKKYGSGALIVAFSHGNGKVVHLLSSFHNEKAKEQFHHTSAYLLSNILDEAVSNAIPDEIQKPTDMEQLAYINMTVLEDPSEKCVFCNSTFKDYDGKVYECGDCNTHYHEFCLEQQMGRDGTCKECGKLMVFEKFKSSLTCVTGQPPPPSD